MIDITQDEIMKNWHGQYDSPLVTIRCITYNQKAYIGQALDSMLMQRTNFPFIIVVHDDASTDGTVDVIRDYERKYPKIVKPIYEKENQYSKRDGSLARIMNAACSCAKYCAACEGDDYWIDCNKLQSQVDFLEANLEYSACSHNVKIIKLDRWGMTGLMYPEKEKILTTENFSENCHINSLVYRSDVLKEWPEFAYNNPTAGDVKLNALLKVRGPIFRFNKVMSVYRRGVAGSWVRRVSKNPEAISNQARNSRLFYQALMDCSPENIRPHFLKQLEWMDYVVLKRSLQLLQARRKYPLFWSQETFKEKIYLYYKSIVAKLVK